jgi:hypothetical protein
MTVLGKILVIVNLVFSLVTGALLILLFSTRTNYQKANEELVKEVQVAHRETDTVKQEALVEKQKCEEKTKAAEDRRKDLARRVAAEAKVQVNDDASQDKVEEDLLAKLRELDKEHEKRVAAEKTRADQEHQNLESIRVVNSRLQNEIDGLQKIVDERNKRIGKLLGEINDPPDGWRPRFVDADLRAKSLQTRNEQLRDQIEAMVKEMEQLRVASRGTGRPAGTAPTAGDKNPPPEDVRGKVTATDAQSGYVTINIGSDAGVSKDNTLEVYRLKPEPKYLGTIRIVAVNPHEAVGRPTALVRRGLIQVGDEVAANILGKR